MAKKSNSNLITDILYIIVGLVLAVMGYGMVKWALIIAGAVFLIFGIIDAIKKNIVSGIVSIVIGLVLIVCALTPLLSYLLIILGILVVVKGIISLINALKKSKKSVIDILFAVLTIVAGLILAFAFGEVADILIRIGGVLLIVNGVLELLGKSLFKK